MSNFKKIPHFMFWCQKVLPLVYDDSLSYYELLNKVVYYLNHVIDDINAVPEYIQSILTDEHLREYVSEIFDDIKEQIARANEGLNETASYDRTKGELVWLDTNLVRMTRDILAGDRYVEEDDPDDGRTGNYVKTSVEIEINRLRTYTEEAIEEILTQIGDLTNLNTESKDNLVNAINEVLFVLTQTTGDLDNLTTSDKSNLVSAINEVLSQAETALSEIGTLSSLTTEDKDNLVDAINELVTDNTTIVNNIGDLTNLITTDKDNLVDAINEVAAVASESVYNVSTPDSGLTTNIGLKEGSYTITSNLTINAQLIVPRGALITVNSGVTLTINGQLLAGRYTIFRGEGNVVIKGNYNEVYPEWFGAVVENSSVDCGIAINKAINASTGGVVSFAPNVYWVATPIVCNKVMTLRGVRDKTYLTAGQTTCSPIVTISGSGSTYVDGATIENMNIGRYSNLAESNALYITRCANTLIRNLRLINCNYGIKYKFTTSTRTEGCISLTALEQSQFFGYLMDCTEAPPLSGTSANGSCYFINCAVNVSAQPTGTCEGFYAGGRDVRDLYFINCETAVTKNGINIDCTGTNKMATDINITNCVLDRCQNHGIRIYGIPSLDGGVKISNTFISLDPQSATPEQGIIIDESWNVFLNNNEIYCNATNATGLYLRNTHGCTISNILFNACGVGMVTQSSSVNAYSNITCRAQTQQATGIILGDSRSVVNNLLFLAYTTGISITGNSNIVVGINRSSTVTTAYSDTGSSNQIAYVN